VRSTRCRLAAATLALGVLSGALLTLEAGATAAPRSAATTPSPLCAYRSQIPRWLWKVLAGVLRVDCGSPSPVTTTVTTMTPTTLPPTTRLPTTLTTPTTPPVSHVFRIAGVTAIVTCSGTPAAPTDCGPDVPTAGQVRINGTVYPTDAGGHFVVATGPPSGPHTVQAVFPAPAGRTLDCPTIILPTGDGVADPVCRSFPA
jgi:hypothetical protein